MKTALYRYFAADGHLLYVGVSNRPLARLEQHKRTHDWTVEVCRITIEWLADRASAIRAEQEAIQDESPEHNLMRYDGRWPTQSVDPWIVEHTNGLRCRLYRRCSGGPIYIELRDNGCKNRKSLGVNQAGLAEETAWLVLEGLGRRRVA
jgi:predicted GIY-YIG superfamily endonuclease